MTNYLGRYVQSRERILGSPGKISLDIAAARHQIEESIGIPAGRRWARAFLQELRDVDDLAPIVIELARVPDLVEEARYLGPESAERLAIETRIRSAVVDAVAALTGHDG